MSPHGVLFLAGLSGALGVILSALGAHVPGGASLGTAGTFLILHGAAFMALAALAGQGQLRGSVVALLAAGWGIGLALFCGDLAARVFLGSRLFPSAAPAGGIVLIATWVALAIASFLPRR
jgi:uncharacterized membrane protein YgdD (TMEM256/DUF423 family)